MAREYEPLEREEEDPEEPSNLVPKIPRDMKAQLQHDKPFNDDKIHEVEDQSEIRSGCSQELQRQPSFSPRDYQQMDFECPASTREGVLNLRFTRIFHKSPSSELYRFRYLIAIISSFLLGGILRPIVSPFQYTSSMPSKASLMSEAHLSTKCIATSYWEGWQSISRNFAFGDSWSSTSFDFTGPQPSALEPFGNPPFPGITSSNSTNWLGYLTTKYNQSTLLTYDLAVGGTTLDNHIQIGFPISVNEAIYQRFMLMYADASSTPWTPPSTLFVMFVGINDILALETITGSALVDLNEKLEAMRYKLLSTLYGTGARNFLLLNLPPMERMWLPSWQGQEVRDKTKSDVATYNNHIERVAGRFKGKYDDANVWLFDVNKLFNRALDNPQAFPQLKNVLNTTSFCLSYASGTPTPDYFDPLCDIPVNQYFWLNPLHPTYPIHDVLAEQVVRELERGPNIC